MVGYTVMLVAGLAGWIFFRNMHERSLQKAIMEDRWVPSWSASEFIALAGRVEENYACAIKALAAHDDARAYALAREREGLRLLPWVEYHAEREFRPGLTVRRFYDDLQAGYFAAVMQEFDWMVDAVRGGQRDLRDLEKFVAWHSEIIGLRQRFDDECQTLKAAKRTPP